MTIEEAKKELIKRYRYLYENAYLILAPYMYEESEEEYKVRKKQEYGTKPAILLKINISDNINVLLEEFLLSDKPAEESSLYKMIETKRNDKDYLELVKKGLSLVEKANKDKKYEMFKIKLSIWEILEKVTDYIEEQSDDIKNKERKLCVLDEYYRILRYKNDGKIYTSGRKLDLHDVSSISVPLYKREPSRDKTDIGVANNDFITTITNAPHNNYNCSIFSEEEKQQVYLNYHDELPYYAGISCKKEENKIPITDIRLTRPKNTKPCGENFLIKESEIFINPDDTLYRYYHLCPHCGYIVNIPKEILSTSIIKRIEDRCKRDEKLFRKMYLYSELFSLEKETKEGQKRLLKK